MAPKTSLFPRLRPNFQEIEREKIQAEEARLRQIKTMGDLEFTADMQPQFVGQMSQEIKDYIGGDNPEKSKYRKIFTYLDDPIAEYGFDPDRIRFEEPSKNPSTYDIIRNDYPENESNAYYASGDVHTDKGTESDVIKYGVKLGSSKEIIAHEARHRGFQLLRNMQLEGSKEDQEAWVKKYGKDAAWLLNLYFSTRDNREFTSEAINELRDRVDTTFNPPKFDAQGNPAGMGAFSGGNFNEGVRNVFLEDLRKSKKSGTIEATQFKDQDDNPLISLDNSQINRAFRGLDQAAKDAMKKQKDDYRKKMTVRSQEGKRKYAQGGVAMKDQMEMSFALGGVAETVDPVSGNDVPPGSLPVEVRDDIPARLSEGEYVVPADVVRFFGVKFFEDIRMQAKMGLQQMEEDGRIGGEPVEMASADVDIDSLIDAEMSSMNEGGLMSGYANAGSVVGRRGVGSSYGGRNLSYGTPIVSAKDVIPEIETPEDIAKKLPEVVTPVQAASAGFTGTRTYYDSKGMPVSIQFINGQPQQSLAGLTEKNPLNEGPSLPAGFMSQADFELAVAKGEINPITGLRWSSSKEKETELQGRAKLVNENLNFKDPQKTLDWARDTIATGSEGDSLGFKALGTIGSVLTGGLMGTAINAITVGTNRATVRAAAQIAEDRGYTELSKNLYTIAKGKKKTLATGNSYADDIRKAATQITSGKATPFVGDGSILTGGLTNIKEGLFREDFSPDELGQKKFEESMQDSAPEGYVYVPSATRFIPSSTSLVQTQTGSRIYPTKMVSQTIAGRTVTDPGSYKPKEGYVAGRVGGSPTGKIIRRVARPTKPGEGDGPPPSNVKTSGYVTGAVDRKGNRIQDGTGLAKSDNTYTTSNPKPGSMQDKENKSEDSSNNKSIVCTEMYRQTQLADWSKAMKTWDIYQKKYLTPAHEIGYHWLFRPYVRGMQKNNTLTRLGAYLATERTQHLRHILTKGKAKDSLVGKVWCSIIHPVVYAAGKIKGET